MRFREFRVRFWLFLLLGVCAVGAADAASPTRIRVLCYNIHHGEGTDGVLDLERIAGVIKSVQPDVVALQEVDNKTNRTQRVDQVAELGRLTQMATAYGKNIDFDGGGYGNAILSKLPMQARENLALPSLRFEGVMARQEQRGVLIVELELPAGQSILFASTHLDARRPDDERWKSAQAINERFGRENSDAPVLLAGDLNSVRDSRVLEELQQKWQVVGDEAAPTVPADKPRRQIDFILCQPAGGWRVIECQVLPEPVASDHRPLFAVLELSDNEL